MSRETLDWLNTNTLIGFTEKRGTAWHYRSGATNHYPGAIPLADVKRRLFDWEAEERPLYVGGGWDLYGDPHGYQRPPFREIPDRKAIVRSDNGHVLGIFREGYQPHQYQEWLLGNVANILDDSLAIGSAGLLKGGAVAWVSVEVPENVTTRDGVEFRPNLLACTSFDGSLATTYKLVSTNVVCDNTLDIGLSESGGRLKVRHSKNSMGKIRAARDALGLVHTISDEFTAEIEKLCAQDFDDRQFEKLVDHLAPMPKSGADKTDASKRAITMAENKRDTLWDMWRFDARVEPWNGTAFGAWQAFNTYRHHSGIVRGMSRPERNMLRALDGTGAADDLKVIEAIHEFA